MISAAACGGNLTADSNWLTLHTPNYPNLYPPSQACNWYINAPKGSQIELQFLGLFDISSVLLNLAPFCWYSYAEVKYLGDKQLVGPRSAKLSLLPNFHPHNFHPEDSNCLISIT